MERMQGSFGGVDAGVPADHGGICQQLLAREKAMTATKRLLREQVVAWSGTVNRVCRRNVTFGQANRHLARLLKKGREEVKVPA